MKISALSLLMKMCAISIWGLILAFSVQGQSTGECPDIAERISYGDTITASIDDVMTAQLFCFTGTRGDPITITASTVAGNLDTQIVLSGLGFQPIYADNDDVFPGNTDSRISIELPVSGNLLIVVTRYNLDQGTTTGDFELSLELHATLQPVIPEYSGTLGLFDDRGECATEMSMFATVLVNRTITGFLTSEEPLIGYCFVANAGDEITLEYEVIDGDMRPLVVLSMLVDGEFIDLTDDAVLSFENGIYEQQYFIPEDGTYLVGVGPLSGESGKFNLTVNRSYTCNDSPWNALLSTSWVLSENETSRVFSFFCDRTVEIETDDGLAIDRYTFEDNTIVFENASLVFENVFIQETFMLISQGENYQFLISSQDD